MFNNNFGKLASDLLKKDFPSTIELNVNSTNPGVATVDTSFNLNPDGTFTGLIKPSFPLANKTDLEGTLSTTGVQNVKVVSRDLLTPGLKANVNLEFIRRQVDARIITSQKVSTGADYVHKNGTVSAKFSLPSLSVAAPDMVLGTVFTKDQWALGVEGAFSSKNATLCDRVTANVEWKNAESVVTASASTSAARQVSATLRYFYRYPQFDIATELTWNQALQKGDAAVGFARVAQGGGLAKLVLKTSGSVGLSYKKRVAANTNMLVGTEVDVATLAHRTGFAFTIDC